MSERVTASPVPVTMPNSWSPRSRFVPSPSRPTKASGWSRRSTDRRVIGLLILAAIATIVGLRDLVGEAQAQTLAPPGSGLTMQSGENVGAPVSKDPLGRPCADIEAAARAHVANPNVYDHVVSVVNRCLKPLKLRVCYFNSDRCFDLAVPATKRKDLVLGIFPGMNHFRYSYKEIP
jgi:hypothetical protein